MEIIEIFPHRVVRSAWTIGLRLVGHRHLRATHISELEVPFCRVDPYSWAPNTSIFILYHQTLSKYREIMFGRSRVLHALVECAFPHHTHRRDAVFQLSRVEGRYGDVESARARQSPL